MRTAFRGTQMVSQAHFGAMQAIDILENIGTGLMTGGVVIVDCSATLGPSTPVAKPGTQGEDPPAVEINPISEYDSDGPFWAWNWLNLGEHSGTHLAAPRHWTTGKDHADGRTDTLDVQRLVAPANVIDCSSDAAQDPDFLLTADRVRNWEGIHGPIGEGEWVLMRTDWDKRAHDRDQFLNEDETGQHSPGPSADCIEYLLSKKITGWGTQTVSIDAGVAAGFEPAFPAHALLHGANRFGLASLANLDRLPPKGAILVAAPLKFVRGTGSPIRALALVPGKG